MKQDYKKLWPLFWTFFKIGGFTFGGGYAMIPLIQKETVDNKKWITDDDILEIIAIAESTPGPVAINSATFVGYTAVVNDGGTVPLAVLGSLTASLAVMLPSIVLMLIVSRFFMKYSKHRNVENVFRLLRPAVVGLIASAALLLMTEENFGSPAEAPLQFWVSVALFVAAFVAMKFYKVSPILILLLAGVFGGVFYGLI